MTDYDNLTLLELARLDSEIMDNLEARRKISVENGGSKFDATLTDEQVNIRDKISFFKTKRQNEDDVLKINDIFHSSWGYDQTNIEHFQVKEISPSGKTCMVQQIGTSSVEGSGYSHGMADSVVPDPTCIIVQELLRVKVERHTEFNPITRQREAIGEIGLRGSVWYAQGHGKHLQNLYRVKKGESNYRSWYA